MKSPEPVSAADFRRFVDQRGFSTVDYVTPHLVHGTITGDDRDVNVIIVHRSKTAPIAGNAD